MELTIALGRRAPRGSLWRLQLNVSTLGGQKVIVYSPPEHLIPLIKRVRAAPIAEPPAPWRCTGSHAVGGLTDVGYGRASDLLLVASSSGRGVFDCVNGSRVARDPEKGEPHAGWQDERELEALGIGPLANQLVRTAGLAGGGLPRSTHDGWVVERLAITWPLESLLLVPPNSWIYELRPNRSAAFTKLADESEVRAFGFSPTGRSLVIATSSELTLYARHAP